MRGRREGKRPEIQGGDPAVATLQNAAQDKGDQATADKYSEQAAALQRRAGRDRPRSLHRRLLAKPRRSPGTQGTAKSGRSNRTAPQGRRILIREDATQGRSPQVLLGTMPDRGGDVLRTMGAAKPTAARGGRKAPPPRKRPRTRRPACDDDALKAGEFTADQLGQAHRALDGCVWRRRHSGEPPPPKRLSSPVVTKCTSAMKSGRGVNESGLLCAGAAGDDCRGAARRNHRDAAGRAAPRVAQRRGGDGFGRPSRSRPTPIGWDTASSWSASTRRGSASVYAGGCAIWPPPGPWTEPRPPRRSR